MSRKKAGKPREGSVCQQRRSSVRSSARGNALFIARHDRLSQSVIGIPAQSMRPTARGGPSGERRGGFRQCSLGSAALFIRKRSARLRPAQSGLCRSDLRGLGGSRRSCFFLMEGSYLQPAADNAQLEREPEKWASVFRKDHAQTKR